MRSAMGFDHAQISEHQGGRLRLHRSATVGMQGQLTGRHGMLAHGIEEQCLEQGRTFRVLDPPADNAPSDQTATEDVEDGVEIETGPFHRPHQRGPHQLGDVPGPDLIGCLSQQFGLLPVLLCDGPDDGAGGGAQ